MLFIAAGDKFYTAKDYINAMKNYSDTKNIKSSEVNVFFYVLVENGDDLNNQKNYPAALDYYKKAATMNPNDSKLKKKIWQIYKNQKNNYEDAVKFYEALTEINPKDYGSYFRLGYSYDEVGNYYAAVNAYQNALRLYPESYIGYYNLGYVYLNLQDYDSAIQSFKNSINLNVNDDDVHDKLELSYNCKFIMDSDSFDDAVKFYTSLVNQYKENPTLYYWLGYYSLGYPDEAVKALKKSIKLKPEARSYYQLGFTYEYMEKPKKALEAYKKALELDPDHKDAKNRLAKLSAKK